jgi:hypothetical protein
MPVRFIHKPGERGKKNTSTTIRWAERKLNSARVLNLNSLNPQQRQSVETLNGPVLILVGAGTGKNRVHHVSHRVRALAATALRSLNGIPRGKGQSTEATVSRRFGKSAIYPVGRPAQRRSRNGGTGALQFATANRSAWGSHLARLGKSIPARIPFQTRNLNCDDGIFGGYFDS